MRKGLVSNDKFPVAAPRRKGEIARRNKEPVLPASSTALAAAVVAACAGGGGGGAGAKGGGASGGSAAEGANVARHSSKKTRIRGSAGGEAGAGNRGERGGSHGLIGRKRVRVVDEKLGEFAVFLTRYDGGEDEHSRARVSCPHPSLFFYRNHNIQVSLAVAEQFPFLILPGVERSEGL